MSRLGPECGSEQARVDGFGHRRVPSVVRVQVVAAVERRVESVRTGRIAQCLLEAGASVNVMDKRMDERSVAGEDLGISKDWNDYRR